MCVFVRCVFLCVLFFLFVESCFVSFGVGLLLNFGFFFRSWFFVCVFIYPLVCVCGNRVFDFCC